MTDSATSVFPGAVRQFGFVVTNLDEAIAAWVGLGVGPWFVTREIKMEGCLYRGQPAEPVISIALANAGDMQIELIAQHDESPSIYKEFLDATGGGFNQVAYWVKDVDAVRKDAEAAGWTEVWSGDPGVKFSYLEHPQSPVTIVELTEDNELMGPANEAIRAAAVGWTADQPPLAQDIRLD